MACPSFVRVTSVLLASSAWACSGASTPPVSSASDAAAPEAQPLDPSKIVFAMRGHERDFRVCFFKAPQQRGTVRVAFDVDPAGVVAASTLLDSSIAQESVEACLLEQTRALRFGTQRGATQGSWTFVYGLVEPMSEGDKRALAERKQKAEKSEADANAERDDPSVVVEASSPGRLEVGQIEETVEVGFPLFARCYRDALNRRDKLGGSVKFRLAIDERGRVAELSDAGSEMPDPLAVDCIAEGFYAMNFPAPNGGSVTALYRLELD